MRLTTLQKLKLLKELNAPVSRDLRYWRFIRKKYNEAIHNALKREVPFNLSLAQWVWIWAKSGKWDWRGKQTGQYQMCRYRDEGPYAVGNVYIDTMNNNLKHRKNPILPPGADDTLKILK